MARTWILRNVVLVALIHLGLSPMAWSEPVAFNVKTYFVKEPGKRQLVEKDAVLVLDDSTRKLTVRSKERPLDTSFDDIEKVVFEVSARRRGGAWSQLGIVGAIVAAQTINDYWCHLAVQTPQGTEHYLLEIPKDTSSTVIDRAKALLGPKILIPTFAEQPKAMRIEDLKARESKQDLKVERKTFLTPELKPDKALVVVLSPIWSESILQTKLHANDEVVATTRWARIPSRISILESTCWRPR